MSTSEQQIMLESMEADTLRNMVIDLWAALEKMESNHAYYREWTDIIENQYYDRMKELEEKLKPIPLKDKFTQGLQFQVAKINELEQEIKNLRHKMPSKLQLDFCANIDLHLVVAKREAATECCKILMENVNDHGYQFGCEEAFVAIKKKFGLAL